MPENKEFLYSKTKSIFPNQTKYATKYSFINVTPDMNFQTEKSKFSEARNSRQKITELKEKNRY